MFENLSTQPKYLRRESLKDVVRQVGDGRVREPSEQKDQRGQKNRARNGIIKPAW